MSIQATNTAVSWDCPICLDPLANAKSVMTRRCLHIFHESCIKQSIERDHKCPTCRNFGLNTSELVECDRIKGLYQSCVLGQGLFSTTSTLEQELLKAHPSAKTVDSGYEVTTNFGNGQENRIVKPHHLLRPLQYHGKPQIDEMTPDDIHNLMLEIQKEVFELSKALHDPNASEEEKQTVQEKLVRLDKEFEDAHMAYYNTFPQRKAEADKLNKEFWEQAAEIRKSNAEFFKRHEYEQELDKRYKLDEEICRNNDYGTPNYKKANAEMDEILAEKKRLHRDSSYKPYLTLPKIEHNPEMTLSHEAPIQNKSWSREKLVVFGVAGLFIAYVINEYYSFYQKASNWWHDGQT